MSHTLLDLAQACTQERFGQLVGIGQPAVSALLDDDTLQRGDTVAAWLLDYCKNLREQAAGRGMDGELAFQRAELARVSRERNEIKLAVERREFAAVALLEQVLATVGRSIAGALEPLHVTLHKRHPELSAEVLKLVQTEVARACDLAVSMSLAVLEDAAEGDDADTGKDEVAQLEDED